MESVQSSQKQLIDNKIKYNIPQQYINQNQNYHSNDSSKSKKQSIKSPYPIFESVINIEEKKSVLIRVDPIYLLRKSFIYFIANILCIMAIVSLGFFSYFKTSFLSHSKIFYFILFFSFLSLSLITVFNLSIRECSRLYPFNIILYFQMAISMGLLLTLLQDPIKVNMFLANIILLIMAYNAVLHHCNEFRYWLIMLILSSINLIFFMVMIAITTVFSGSLIMLLVNQFFIFYIALPFPPLLDYFQINDKDDYIYISSLLYTAIPYLILSVFVSIGNMFCGRNHGFGKYAATHYSICPSGGCDLSCLACDACNSSECCSNLSCSGEFSGNGEDIGEICCCCCYLIGGLSN